MGGYLAPLGPVANGYGRNRLARFSRGLPRRAKTTLFPRPAAEKLDSGASAA